jgi:hypothetical protein
VHTFFRCTFPLFHHLGLSRRLLLLPYPISTSLLWALVTCCVTAFGPNLTSVKYYFFRLPCQTLTLSSPLSSPLSSAPSSPGLAHHRQGPHHQFSLYLAHDNTIQGVISNLGTTWDALVWPLYASTSLLSFGNMDMRQWSIFSLMVVSCHQQNATLMHVHLPRILLDLPIATKGPNPLSRQYVGLISNISRHSRPSRSQGFCDRV